MQWQDWVFSVGGFFILISLIPTIRGDQKPALTTSLMTTVLVTVFASTMATLGLWFSALANYLIAIAWGILALQRYTAMKRERNESALAQIEDELEVSLAPGSLDREAAATTPETPRH